MKPVLFTACMMLFLGITWGNDHLDFNSNEVQETFSKLSKLEQMHYDNPQASLSELTSDADFSGLVIEAATISSVSNAGDLPLLPAFWWGCILGAIGILLVYLITEDQDQTMKALWGCLAWVGFWILWWVFWVLILGGSFWFW